MAARMVNAIPTANANLVGFGFGAMFPYWLTLLVPVTVLVPQANRGRCVRHFTLRILIILIETIKDLYYRHGLRPPFLEARRLPSRGDHCGDAG